MEVVGVAHNGQDCLEMLEERKSGCFSLRYYYAAFRWFSGSWKVSRESKEKPCPNVIMLTAFGQEDVTKKAVELGASYFILKPFDMENLEIIFVK